ncbi:hypothetical protein [Sphingobacterium detergens]|uniref:hypothetical protein n=1 Tax=Sphingobacterium detergens TaxID=1145106 RepID=UPI003AAD7E77
MYAMFPASCSRGWLERNSAVNASSLNRWIDKYIELGIIKSTNRPVPCRGGKRIVKSFMLTPYGKKYIDQFYQNIFNQLKPKDQTELINSPIYSDIINL